MSRVLVTGGHGMLGRELVPLLVAAGHLVTVASRHPRPSGTPDAVEVPLDVTTGEGVGEALAGQEVVVHLATDPSRAEQVDVEGTRRLLDAAATAGVSHLVFVSIVGVDGVSLGYYRAKRRTEQLIAESPVPHTILRATQFHQLVARFAETLARLPVVPAPRGVVVQPIDAVAVAERVVELVAGEPAGRVADMGGRDRLGVDEAFAGYLAATGRRRMVVRVPVPQRLGLRSGTLLTPNRVDDGRSWREFLAGIERRARRPVR